MSGPLAPRSVLAGRRLAGLWRWVLPVAVALGALAQTARIARADVPTPLVLIGGGPDDPAIMAQTLSLAGGAGAHVAILPYASSDPSEAAGSYQHYFGAFGVQTDALELASPAAAGSADLLAREAAADLLFFAGGDQSRLVATLKGTPLLGAIVDAWRRGAVVAGTSGSAMPWGSTYIAGGTSRSALAIGLGKDSQGKLGLDLRPGLQLASRLLVDTHFDDDARLGRLLLAEAARPSSVALGIDQGTAAILTGQTVHAMGSASVTVLEAPALTGNDASQTGPTTLFAAGPFEMERLIGGQSYELGSAVSTTPQMPAPSALPAPGGWFGWFGRPAATPAPAAQAPPAAGGPPEPVTLIGDATPPGPRDAVEGFVRDAGGTQARLLILAGDEAAPDAEAWRGALMRAGAGSAIVQTATDLHDQSLASALERSTGVFFVEDGLGTLLTALDADSRDLGDVVADYAPRLPMAAAGLGIRILGDVAYLGHPGQPDRLVMPGLDLLKGVVADDDPWEPWGLERLIQATLMAGRATGFALTPGSDLRIAGGQALVGGSAQVLVVEGNGVQAYTLPASDSATPASATGLAISVIAPQGAYDLVHHTPRF